MQATIGTATVLDKEPSKATKGRRMSKITRMKTPKAAAMKTVKKTVAAKAAPTKKPAAKKSAKTSAKPAKTAAAKPPTTAASFALNEGDRAPAFTLPRDGGDSVSLSNLTGKKCVLFFYPRADTPGCTLEAIAFTRLKPDFEACDTEVIGVSADPLAAQNKFRDKHKLATPLLSDETQTMLKAYGGWGKKSMYGKVFEGVLRTTFLIDRDGKIANIWRNVKVDGHAEHVLEAARAL